MSSFYIACAVAKFEGALLGADWEPRTIDLDVPTPNDDRLEPFDPFEQPTGQQEPYSWEEEEADLFYTL